MSFALFKRESAGEIHIEPADFAWLSDYLHQDEHSTSPVLPLPSTTLLGGSKHLSEKQALLSPLSPAFFKLDRGDDPSVSLRKAEWRPDEDLVILATFRRLGTQWGRIAAQLPGRTSDGVRNRWHRLQRRHGLGESLEGRRALDELLLSCGIDKNWMPPSDPLVSLDEDEKNADHGRTMWTTEEDAIIREGVRQHGFKWRQIAASLPGRSDSSVRNRWRRLEKEQGGASPDSKVEGDESAGEGSPASPALSPLRADSAAAAAADSQLFSPPKRQRTVDAAMPSGAAAAAVPVGPPIRRAVTAPGAVAPLRPRPAPVRVDSDLVDLVNVAVEEEWSPLRDLARTLEDFPEYAPGEPSTSGAREPSPFRDQSIMSALSSSSTAVNSDHDDDDDADGANRKRFRPMWTGEEDMFIVRYVEQHGRLWSKIAELMEGRSHRAVRNRWLRMQKGQATREKRGPDNGYRCRRCGELKLGHICSAGMATPPNPPSFNL